MARKRRTFEEGGAAVDLSRLNQELPQEVKSGPNLTVVEGESTPETPDTVLTLRNQIHAELAESTMLFSDSMSETTSRLEAALADVPTLAEFKASENKLSTALISDLPKTQKTVADALGKYGPFIEGLQTDLGQTKNMMNDVAVSKFDVTIANMMKLLDSVAGWPQVQKAAFEKAAGGPNEQALALVLFKENLADWGTEVADVSKKLKTLQDNIEKEAAKLEEQKEEAPVETPTPPPKKQKKKIKRKKIERKAPASIVELTPTSTEDEATQLLHEDDNIPDIAPKKTFRKRTKEEREALIDKEKKIVNRLVRTNRTVDLPFNEDPKKVPQSAADMWKEIDNIRGPELNIKTNIEKRQIDLNNRLSELHALGIKINPDGSFPFGRGWSIKRKLRKNEELNKLYKDYLHTKNGLELATTPKDQIGINAKEENWFE